MLLVGLRGGEVFKILARGYEQCAQAEALRCTKQKALWRGRLLREQRPKGPIANVLVKSFIFQNDFRSV